MPVISRERILSWKEVAEQVKTTYYVAVSLDGYIADTNGGVDWLDDISIDQNGTGYESFYAGIDGLIMRRATYDFVYDYGQWPYDDKPTWVCTTREISPLDGCNLQQARDAVIAISEAKSMGLKSMWMVGGGVLASSMLKQGLLTHISVSVMPVILGRGVKLFDALPKLVHIEQASSTEMGGFTQIEYAINS